MTRARDLSALKQSLSATTSGAGANLVGYKSTLDGEIASTVQGAIDSLKDDSLSVSGVWQRGSSTAIKAANKVALSELLANAASQNKAVYIPSGDWYCDPGATVSGLVRIISDGTVYTSATSYFMLQTAVGGAGALNRNGGCDGGRWVNTNGTQAQKSSAVIRYESDGCMIEQPEFYNMQVEGFYQAIDNAAGHYTTGFGEEGRMNHGVIDNCYATYYGALNSKYFIRHRSGSGTGWNYSNCRDAFAVGTSPAGSDPVGSELLGYPAFVRVEAGGVAAVISDMFFGGHVSGLQAGAISVDGNCTYNSNLSILPATQIDAQAKRALFYDPMIGTMPIINVTVAPTNVGGDIDIADNMPRTVGSRFYAQGFSEAYGGRYDASLIGSGAQSKPLVEIQMQSAFSCQVELWASGETSGVVAGGLRKRVYAIRHDGATVTATDITAQGYSNPVGISADFFDFSASVVFDKVTFDVVWTAAASGSKLAAQYRVTGGAWKVRRLQ